MNVDRGELRHRGEAQRRLSFCLDTLESADDFPAGVGWKTTVVRGLTIEELVGAIVAAEIDLARQREDLDRIVDCEPVLADGG